MGMEDDFLRHEERRLQKPLEGAIAIVALLVTVFAIRDHFLWPDVAIYTTLLRGATAAYACVVVTLTRRDTFRVYPLAMSFIIVLIVLHGLVATVLPEGLVTNQTSLFILPLAACGFVAFMRDVFIIQGWLIAVTQIGLMIQRPALEKYVAVETQLLIATLVTCLVGSFGVQARQQQYVLQRKLRDEADRDALTGLYNRRFFARISELALQQSRRHARTLSVLVIDIDHFKSINDQHGHDIGDIVIHATARAIVAQLRAVDVAARLGGEEFVVLLDEADRISASLVAERIREHVSALNTKANSDNVQWTISIGVAELQSEDTIMHSVVRRADRALYAAKRDGRNRVVGQDPQTD